MKPAPGISIKALSKTYQSGFLKKRRTQALRKVSLDIYPGEIFGILGPNGAGKTTLLNILMGLIIPDEGEVYIDHEKIAPDGSMEIRRKMNMCSGNPNFPWCLSVKETLQFYRLLYGVEKRDFEKRLQALLEVLELLPNQDTRYDELSTGNKQRLALAKSLINDPEIILLDEPTIGLDPDISIKIRKMIKTIHTQQRKTILLTTHYMKEAEEMCDRIAFIKSGSIIALGTKEEIKALTKTQTMEEAFIELANQ